MARSRLHRRYKKRRGSDSGPAPRRNPPLFSDLAEFIGPGFAGFAATRLLTRVAATQVAKWKPDLAKHAGAISSVGAFLAAWFFAHKVKWLAKYQQPLVVGAGIAALQSLIQLYVPKLGWAVSDASPEIVDALGAGQTQMQITAPNGAVVDPNDLRAVHDDPGAYTYNDSYDAGRMSSSGGSSSGSPEDDLLASLDLEDGQAQNMGIFNN